MEEYSFPSEGLLNSSGSNKETVNDYSNEIMATLDYHKIGARIVYVKDNGVTVLYAIELAAGVRVARIRAIEHELSVAVKGAIEILIPVPGTNYVGIQAEKSSGQAYLLGDVISTDFFKTGTSKNEIILGRSYRGDYVTYDFSKLAHLMLAGAPGTGKSTFLDMMLVSILYKASPLDIKLILIDTKCVDMIAYNGIPHLMIPIVTDFHKATVTLNRTVDEMMERYREFADMGVRTLEEYNALPDVKRIPRIIIVIDDLNDLLMGARDAEQAIIRISQLSRAAGINLIVSTKRPVSDIISGLIRSNITNRIAFSMVSKWDSRSILGDSGAELLREKGEMLFKNSEQNESIRVKVPFVAVDEVDKVVEYIKENNNPPEYEVRNLNEEIMEENDYMVDELFIKAGRFIIQDGKASIGNLQRKFRIVFNRAARIMDELGEVGVVGEEQGSRPRKILMTLEQFEQYIDEHIGSQ